MKKIKASQIDQLRQISEQPINRLECKNWAEYPGGPETSLQIATCDQKLVLLFTVREEEPRAVNTQDHQPVYQDSCVEFFCQKPGTNRYFNFEFNSLGTCLASTRISRNEDVVSLSESEMAQITREPRKIDGAWQLLVTMPLALIAGDSLPKTLQGNFYKCGDLTAEPHFISAFAINAPKPDFHRPEAFGEIELA